LVFPFLCWNQASEMRCNAFVKCNKVFPKVFGHELCRWCHGGSVFFFLFHPILLDVLLSCWNYTLMCSRFWFLLVVVYLLVLCKRRKFLIHLFSGVAFDLFFIDGSKSRWPSGAWDCPHVQDWQEQIRDNCKELDPEVCNGLMCCYLCDREMINYCPPDIHLLI